MATLLPEILEQGPRFWIISHWVLVHMATGILFFSSGAKTSDPVGLCVRNYEAPGVNNVECSVVQPIAKVQLIDSCSTREVK